LLGLSKWQFWSITLKEINKHQTTQSHQQIVRRARAYLILYIYWASI
jgi:hypothetical protein